MMTLFLLAQFSQFLFESMFEFGCSSICLKIFNLIVIIFFSKRFNEIFNKKLP